MKKLIAILLIVLALNGYGQELINRTNKTSAAKVVDTIPKVKDTIPKNDEPIVSMDQLNKVLADMRKKMSIDELPLYEEFRKQMQLIIDEALTEWKKRKQLKQ